MEMQGTIYLTADELAERWRMSERTLRAWRAEKKGPPFFKRGGEVLYMLKDIETYEIENTEQLGNR